MLQIISFNLNKSRCVKHLLFYLFIGISLSTSAQNNAILDSCLQKLSECESGSLDVILKQKYLFDSDTTIQKQSILFFTDEQQETNVVFLDYSVLHVLFQNQYLYSIDNQVYFQGVSSIRETSLIPYVYFFHKGRYFPRDTNEISYLGTEKIGTTAYHKYKREPILAESEKLGPMNALFYIYINTTTYLPEKIISQIDYMNSTQYQEIDITVNSLYTNIDYNIYDSISSEYNILKNKYFSQEEEDIIQEEESQIDTVSFMQDWSLPLLTGDTLHSKEITSSLVILDFWYVSCAPCLQAIKELVVLDSLYSDNDLKIVGVNVYDTTISKMQSIAEFLKMKYDIVCKGMELSINMGNRRRGYPDLFLIDTKSRKVIYHIPGYNDKMLNKLQGLIDEYLMQNRKENK